MTGQPRKHRTLAEPTPHPGRQPIPYKMKLTKLTHLLVVVAVMAFASTGCKHKKPGTTDLGKIPGKTGTMPTPGPGGTLGSGGGLGSESTTSTPIIQDPSKTGGIAQGPGHFGWPENAEIFKSDTVYFAFDSSVVNDGEKSKVAAVADYLKANAADAVRIAGHCDERGTEEYNRALGERRALALREELVRLGLDATRVDTVSFGKDRPAVDGHNEAAWKMNRRGEFILLTPPAAQ
jgi:peptidoglycan-associated lipoprotein